LAARYLEKKTRRFFDVFRAPPAPPLPVSSGYPEVDPTMDQNRRSRQNIGLIKNFSRVYPEKGKHVPGK